MDNLFEILWSQPGCVKLPTTSWGVHRISRESEHRCITFVNMTVFDTSSTAEKLDTPPGPELPKIERQVIINQNLQTHFSIGNINLNNVDAWPWKSHFASSINNIIQFISDFSKLNICIGGPKVKFWKESKNQAHNAIVRRQSTRWQHKQCSLVCIGRFTCDNCELLYKILQKQTNKSSNPDSLTQTQNILVQKDICDLKIGEKSVEKTLHLGIKVKSSDSMRCVEIDESFRLRNQTLGSINNLKPDNQIINEIKCPLNLGIQNEISDSEISDLDSERDYDSESDSEPTVVEVRFIDEMKRNKASNEDKISSNESLVVENSEFKPKCVATGLKQSQLEINESSQLETQDKICIKNNNVIQKCALESEKTEMFDQNKLEIQSMDQERLDIEEVCADTDDEYDSANIIKQNKVSIFKNGEKQIYASDILDIKKSTFINTNKIKTIKNQVRVLTNEEIEENWKIRKAEYLENTSSQFMDHIMDIDSNMDKDTRMNQDSNTVPNLKQDPVIDKSQNMNQHLIMKKNLNKDEDLRVQLRSTLRSKSRKCAVPNCYSKGYRLTRFPTRNLDLFDKWLGKINNPLLLNMPKERIYNSYRVCLKHFKEKWILPFKSDVALVDYDAFPTLYLPEDEFNTSTATFLSEHDYSAPLIFKGSERDSVFIADNFNSNVSTVEVVHVNNNISTYSEVNSQFWRKEHG